MRAKANQVRCSDASAQRRARALRNEADGADGSLLGDPPVLTRSALSAWLNRDPPRPHRIPVHTDTDAEAILARVLAEPVRDSSSEPNVSSSEPSVSVPNGTSSGTNVPSSGTNVPIKDEVMAGRNLPSSGNNLPVKDEGAPEKWTERPNYERDKKRRWRAMRREAGLPTDSPRRAKPRLRRPVDAAPPSAPPPKAPVSAEQLERDRAAHVKRQQAYRQRLKAKAQDEAVVSKS